MSRKSISWLGLLAALAVATTSRAADYLFEDFEDTSQAVYTGQPAAGPAGFGWGDWQGYSFFGSSYLSYTYSTTGVTHGSHSMKMTIPYVGARGFYQGLSYKLQQSANPAADFNGFISNTDITFDVTFNSADWPRIGTTAPDFAQIFEVGYNEQGRGGFIGLHPDPAPLVGTKDSAIQWNPDDYPGLTTITMSYKYSQYLPQLTSDATNGYIEFIMTTNSQQANYSTGAYYFDNFRFTTPVTILKGDLNFDGHVNAKDIAAMELALTNTNGYLSTDFGNGTPTSHGVTVGNIGNYADVSGSGLFNNSDLQQLLTYLKNGNGSVSSVPEPASLVLLVLAVPAMAWIGICRGRHSRRC
jgi:Dockerin type I domain